MEPEVRSSSECFSTTSHAFKVLQHHISAASAHLQTTLLSHMTLYCSMELSAGLTCEFWVDASLHAGLRGAAGPGFLRPARDLCIWQQVGRTAQLLRNAPLAEGAEAACIRAPVGVIDVSATCTASLIPLSCTRQPYTHAGRLFQCFDALQ